MNVFEVGRPNGSGGAYAFGSPGRSRPQAEFRGGNTSSRPRRSDARRVLVHQRHRRRGRDRQQVHGATCTSRTMRCWAYGRVHRKSPATLGGGYGSTAFIKVFDGSYNSGQRHRGADQRLFNLRLTTATIGAGACSVRLHDQRSERVAERRDSKACQISAVPNRDPCRRRRPQPAAAPPPSRLSVLIVHLATACTAGRSDRYLEGDPARRDAAVPEVSASVTGVTPPGTQISSLSCGGT